MPKVKVILGVALMLIIMVIGIELLSKGPNDVPDTTQDQETPAEPEPEPEPEPQKEITPIDTITEPSRGYLLGTLPIPYDGQGFDEAYQLASETCELVPTWGKPSPYWEKTADIEGD